MKLIAAIDNNWAIGRDGRLLVRLPQDIKYFRQMTMGHVVVMGRKTLESFPEQKPLPGRTNIVLTTNKNDTKDNIITVHSKAELLKQLVQYDTDDVFVIGGESVYRMLLYMCDTAYITHINKCFPADAWFPNLDAGAEWTFTEKSDTCTENDIDFCFKTYQRRLYYEPDDMDMHGLRCR